MEYSTLTLADINKMGSTEYAEHFQDAAFKERVDFLESQPKQPREQGVRKTDVAPVPTSFDPAFDDQPSASTLAPPAPAAAATAAVPAASASTIDESLPELIHEYQPTDKSGRPVGGMQRFKYRTQKELIEKLTRAHMASSVRIRELSRERKLSQILDAGVTTTKVPRPTDVVPDTPEDLAKELRAVRESNYALSIRVAVNTFLENCPEYATRYRSQANNESLILAVAKANDDETDPEAYMRAWATMKDVMEPAVSATIKVHASTPVAAVPTATVELATETIRTAERSRALIATGLSNSDSSSEEAPASNAAGQKFLIDGAWKVLTAADLDRMPTTVMSRLMKNPDNCRKMDALYEEAAARKARR